MSRPSVHPFDVEVPQLREPDNRAVPERMKDVQGMPGTPAGLALRVFQSGFAAVAVAVMTATNDFPSVTAFRYLVAALSLQCLWGVTAIVDLYALLITSTLTFAAACASAGITVLIHSDFNDCAQNHCARFETSMLWLLLAGFGSPSFFLCFWSLASR
ncbi:hypothetical protein E3N88_46269 [Mikania micrantha]|uniref:CASP-like protein n=1 Tax=Mikania micrantha TaxID=192012 RepID=A0A5N6L716_9ASTR|nr:hypothetical protein E3N88_46269 [Mikania micrantha]